MCIELSIFCIHTDIRRHVHSGRRQLKRSRSWAHLEQFKYVPKCAQFYNFNVNVKAFLVPSMNITRKDLGTTETVCTSRASVIYNNSSRDRREEGGSEKGREGEEQVEAYYCRVRIQRNSSKYIYSWNLRRRSGNETKRDCEWRDRMRSIGERISHTL